MHVELEVITSIIMVNVNTNELNMYCVLKTKKTNANTFETCVPIKIITYSIFL